MTYLLADARTEAALKMKQHREGLDPLIEKKRAIYDPMDIVDDLFADWYEGNIKRLKHHHITFRLYTKDIAPVIGQMQPTTVTGRDIRQILRNIAESNRPTIANNSLTMLSSWISSHTTQLVLLRWAMLAA